jgi:hypothetical protein
MWRSRPVAGNGHLLLVICTAWCRWRHAMRGAHNRALPLASAAPRPAHAYRRLSHAGRVIERLFESPSPRLSRLESGLRGPRERTRRPCRVVGVGSVRQRRASCKIVLPECRARLPARGWPCSPPEPHITTRQRAVNRSAEPAICASSGTSAYVPICARSAVVPTVIRARHYVRPRPAGPERSRTPPGSAGSQARRQRSPHCDRSSSSNHTNLESFGRLCTPHRSAS